MQLSLSVSEIDMLNEALLDRIDKLAKDGEASECLGLLLQKVMRAKRRAELRGRPGPQLSTFGRE
jgi:hypothetical protein